MARRLFRHILALASNGRRVLEAQSLGVDVVSGATHSSLTILTAIQNALKKGIKP